MTSIDLIMNDGDAYVQSPFIANVIILGVLRSGKGQTYSAVAPGAGTREFYHDWPAGRIDFGSIATGQEWVQVLYKS